MIAGARAWIALGAASLCLILPLAALRAQPASCQPSVRMKTLLDNVQIGGRGALSLGTFYAGCLPDPARKSQTAFAYNPYDGGKLSTTVKASNGQALTTYVWYAEKISGIWELSRYEVVGGPEAVKPLAVGTYTLEFAVEDKVFQRFPFSVSTVDSKDVYRPATLYLLDGPWADYAELYFPRPERFTQLWVWLRDPDNGGVPRPKPVQYTLRLVRERDGKLIAEGGGATSAIALRPQWTGYKLSFRPLTLPASGSSEFHASELLASDGDHRIELSVDGKRYTSYRVTVKGGAFQRDAAHAREAASALMPLENEPNYWSLRRLTDGR